ncbi:hypothetical protein A3C98_04385 [Candidatus Roizmanbacteria bacterium RIFCSPHIGHO2_02_FULL_37_15]|uniref:Glycosyl transferase family 1 domain-containing protein n=1 Tax=Candidatus Roizmanbacteria bacterium RIFCSPLOWO2_01_FULL_37_16 TaxID=1802058 RepID=A0A1F7IIM8_9BACT|nr:MAG: hypothetical protein A2859_01025 [Candidatus Roizmanbacteria bacterium RIFCSPHIGHO2_01_FULL_37_16b]OGK20730.1 MAG: hypothetical protein A3C98_04385 [Candidatus Roizmanbacteria bacterium RIFCSPHIGHO2_02_FULL_37_15]OGK33321.1 MAG: hypothetical protein A3F57_05265 [Candidatus Roizmanbacteria bacterium RIFCSPHIGHO2_12_FULL_36_11]OGK43215.1 MAG: hypothetical protein A3B40_03050 [Candidatus Roizmanbacteria bacterium RIFCSPLOWO2_01_FULL_37_16]OGK57635.1 MAG: hypothetical protein A3I50_00745 [C
MISNKKIAIVYDWIDKWGGVERVLLTLHEMFPQAEFFTTYYDSENAAWAKNLKIKTSFIQRLPQIIKANRILSLPFYPYIFETFDFSDYELVISVTSSFAKSVFTKSGTLHICYLLTPTRYLWFLQDEYIKNKSVKLLLSPYLAKLREWDFIVAQRPDHIFSISQTVARRCRKFYKRESEVIYPPFDIEYWNTIKSKIKNPKSTHSTSSGLILNKVEGSKSQFKNLRYFLVVSRLEPYKKIDLLINTFNKSAIGRSSQSYFLVVVGEGSELNYLKQIAGEKIVFLNNLSDQELGYLYNNAQALIMPQEEDFGYVSLEAQFFSCPVIAYRKGGALETVVEGKTGIFFDEQSVESLQKVLRRYSMVKYSLKSTTREFGEKNIDSFSRVKFERDFSTLLNSKLKTQRLKGRIIS